MKSIKNNKGFTLTEIVVVIAIIGVLAVALVPKLNSFLGKADRVGAITDFQSSFANVVRAEVIEKGQIPKPSRLRSELEYQFTYHDGTTAEAAIATTETIDKVFVKATEADFKKIESTLAAPSDLVNYRVGYLKDDSTKRYMILYKFKTDVSAATAESLETADVMAVTFVALNTSDSHSVLFKMKDGAKTRDMESFTDSGKVIFTKLGTIKAPVTP